MTNRHEIDQAVELTQQIETLQKRVDAIKARIKGAGVGVYEGDFYAAKVFATTRKTQDEKLKDRIAKLIEKNISDEYIEEHTKVTDTFAVRFEEIKADEKVA